MFDVTQLKEFRKKQQRTLTQVASEAGMSAGWLSLVERGKCDPKIDSLIKVLTVLGYKLEVTFPEKETPEQREQRLDLEVGTIRNRT